jgi:putative serine protease PepD
MLAGPSNPYPRFEADAPAPTDEPADQARPQGTAKRQKVMTIVIAVLALLLTASVAYQLGNSGNQQQQPKAAPKPSPSAPDHLTTAEIFQMMAPSVVYIKTTSPNEKASGTGVVINEDGAIMTAFHVVKGSKDIEVTFADGTKSPAKITESDPADDIATLEVENLPQLVVPATLGGGANVGDDVVAIGNPLQLIDSTTSGVVSGLNRTIEKPEGGQLKGLIQFDAAVNPGSSGGPLVNNQGQTIGIVVALANPTSAGTFIGVGFAVPIGSAVGGGGRPPLV